MSNTKTGFVACNLWVINKSRHCHSYLQQRGGFGKRCLPLFLQDQDRPCAGCFCSNLEPKFYQILTPDVLDFRTTAILLRYRCNTDMGFALF